VNQIHNPASDHAAPQISLSDANRGILSSHNLKLPATFSFKCYGTSFDAVVTRNADGARLTIRGDLGVMPFTAEAKTARQYMRSVVEVGRDLPYAEITLSRTQSIVMRGVMNFEKPPSPATTVAATAVIVIASKPFVDMISTVRTANTVSALKRNGGNPRPGNGHGKG
jgi:hypothetical protein